MIGAVLRGAALLPLRCLPCLHRISVSLLRWRRQQQLQEEEEEEVVEEEAMRLRPGAANLLLSLERVGGGMTAPYFTELEFGCRGEQEWAVSGAAVTGKSVPPGSVQAGDA